MTEGRGWGAAKDDCERVVSLSNRNWEIVEPVEVAGQTVWLAVNKAELTDFMGRKFSNVFHAKSRNART